jgi:hypothetical protein
MAYLEGDPQPLDVVFIVTTDVKVTPLKHRALHNTLLYFSVAGFEFESVDDRRTVRTMAGRVRDTHKALFPSSQAETVALCFAPGPWGGIVLKEVCRLMPR